MTGILARPSAAFFLLAVVVAIGDAASAWSGLWIDYLPAVALYATICGVVWLTFELIAKSRGKRWLGWLSFAITALSALLMILGQVWQGIGMELTPPPLPADASEQTPWLLWGTVAMMSSGYIASVSMAPILPAIVLAVFQPKRVAQA